MASKIIAIPVKINLAAVLERRMELDLNDRAMVLHYSMLSIKYELVPM